jgi:hypothetical protein
MSKWTDLIPRALGRRRPETAVTRAMLDMDHGALIEPADYPYPPGVRPIAPFGARVILPPGNVRSDAQLFPPESIVGRTLAHVSHGGVRHLHRAAVADTSGSRTPAKSVKVRPWLFGGGKASSPAAGGGGASGGDSAGPCDGC